MTFSRSEFLIRLDKDNDDYEETLRKIVEKCTQEAKFLGESEGLDIYAIGVSISSVNLPKPIHISWRDVSDFQSEAVVAKFSKIHQSSTTANLLGEPFQLTVACLGDWVGGYSPTLPSLSGVYDVHTGLFTNHSQDNRCLFRAALMGAIQALNLPNNQSRLARKIAQNDIGSTIDYLQPLLRFCHIREYHDKFPLSQYAPLIEQYLNHTFPMLAPFRLIVVASRSIDDEWLYPPKTLEYPELPKKNLFLYLQQKHYTTIWRPTTWFGHRTFCLECRRSIDTMKRHSVRCRRKCRFCGIQRSVVPCPPDENRDNHKFCDICYTSFSNSRCFEDHKENTCHLYQTCPECESRFSVRKGHTCGEKFCPTCKVFHGKKRGCFLPPLASPKSSPKYKLVVYDFEARQEDQIAHNVFDHRINFAACQVLCNACMDAGTWQRGCDVCGAAFRFWSEAEGCLNPARAFFEFLVETTAKKETTVAMGHFAGRYDIQLLMSEILQKQKSKRLSIIANGHKIFKLSVRGGGEYGEIRFTDSFNLMPLALEKLPRALGLPDDVEDKGFFPHGFNKRCNYSPSNPTLPTIEDYYADGFLPEKRKRFDDWWAAHKEEPFDLVQALRVYGCNDVKLLAHAVVKYRQLVRVISGNAFEDVLFSSSTLAASTLRDLRMNHIRPETVGIIPYGGYGRNDIQSRIALKFLKWLEKERDLHIAHRDNGGEKTVIAKDEVGIVHFYRVDGLVEKDKHVVEVLGDFWHGCPIHQPIRDLVLPGGRTPKKRYDETMGRIKHIQDAGFTVEAHWECEIREQLKQNPEMKAFFDAIPDTTPLRFEDAYSGGRVTPYCFYASADGNGRRIAYNDIMSLYPFILFTKPMPVGHPTRVQLHKAVDWRRPEHIPRPAGIWKVLVLPPRGLYAPVLPLKVDKRLLFPLCRSCAYQNANKDRNIWLECKHTDEERAFITTVTSIELALSLQKGYRVTYALEGYTWAEWTTDVFHDFVAKYLKVKMEASGPPPNTTHEQRLDFLRVVKERYGFDLDVNVDEWEINEGLKFLSKLRLNTAYGKFGQRQDASKLAICQNSQEIAELFRTSGNKIKSIESVTEHVMYVRYKLKEEFVQETNFSNVVYALWVTSAARIHLYEYMEECERNGGKLAYSDTDSLIMEYSADSPPPIQTGSFLGSMENEKLDYEILEFVCGGPKQYGLKLRHKGSGEIKYELKLRGFTLDVKNSNVLCYEKFKEIVLNACGQPKELVASYRRLQPDIRGSVQTRDCITRYKPVFQKGYVSAEDLNTIFPFGF